MAEESSEKVKVETSLITSGGGEPKVKDIEDVVLDETMEKRKTEKVLDKKK